MRLLWTMIGIILFGGMTTFADPTQVERQGILSPDSKVSLRVRQVLSMDGLSRGERILNGLPPLQVGDIFTAEVSTAPDQPTIIVAGSIEKVVAPRRFGRPGRVCVKLACPAPSPGHHNSDWLFAIEDQRFSSTQKRRAITALFMAEGFAIGASVGANLDRGKTGATLGGAGAGLLLGVAYASLQPGQAASLEPGDVLELTLGTMDVKKLPPEVPLMVFPAHEPKLKKQMEHKKPREDQQ